MTPEQILTSRTMTQDIHNMLGYIGLHGPNPELVSAFFAKHGLNEQKQVDHYETKVFEVKEPEPLVDYMCNHGWDLTVREEYDTCVRLKFTKGLQ